MPQPPDHLLISESELAAFLTTTDPAEQARALLEQQKGAWELLRRGYDTLRSVRTRTFDFDDFQIKVQFNPGRLTSTSAKVDASSIRERKCFLCVENLPPGQRGIPHDGEYLVLCNPFPIFPEHFTISSFHHTPQRIFDSFAMLLELTRQLGTRYTVFYNGPKCGASAPDHLHFQAGNKSFVPLDAEYEAMKAGQASRLVEAPSLRAFSVENYLRRFISFESREVGLLQRAFAALHELLQQVATDGEEPMLNILGFYSHDEWRIVVFPRARHRPSFYFKEGAEKLLISPAAVELGGVCTTPRQEDFDRVTREHIVQMFNEVCIPAESFARLKAGLACRLPAVLDS